MKRSTISFTFDLVFLVTLSTSMCVGQTLSWVKLNGSGSSPWSITFHPQGAILTAHIHQGVFRSTDEGTTWTSINDGLPISAGPGPDASAVAISPDGQVFLAVNPLSMSQVFRSTDLGDHWTATNFPQVPFIRDLVINPNGVLFASTEVDGIYRSIDQGTTWTKLSLGPFWSANYKNSLVIDNNGTLYFGWRGKGVYVSTNEGVTWTRNRKVSRLSDGFPYVMTTDQQGTAYLAYSTAVSSVRTMVYSSRNHGRTWRKALFHVDNNATSSPIISSIASPGDGRTIFLGDWGRGVYVSTNSGRRWSWMNDGIDLTGGGVSSLALGPDGRLYAGAAQGVYRTVNPVSGIAGHSSPQETPDVEPLTFALHQNYPNPFNPTTTIEFELAQDALVTVKVYNTLGQEVATLAEKEEFGEGGNELEFDGSNLPSGVYYYRIVAEEVEGKGILYSNVKKMMLVK